MAIVVCEHKDCKYYEEGFYCTKRIVEITDCGHCKDWLVRDIEKQKEEALTNIVTPLMNEDFKFFNKKEN